MGELIHIFVPKCHIHQLFYGRGKDAGLTMCQVHQDRKQAQRMCDECQESDFAACPVGDPGIYSFTVEIDLCSPY